MRHPITRIDRGSVKVNIYSKRYFPKLTVGQKDLIRRTLEKDGLIVRFSDERGKVRVKRPSEVRLRDFLDYYDANISFPRREARVQARRGQDGLSAQ